MHSKYLFLLLLVMATSLLWFGSKSGKAIYQYINLNTQLEASLEGCEAVELGTNRFGLLTTFFYSYRGKNYKKSEILGKEYPNPWAAAKAKDSLSKGSCVVWISSKKPEVATLEKKFPLKMTISALVMFGILGYFLILAVYVKGKSMGNVKEVETIFRIKALSDKGEHLVASFLPGKGMNLISYKKGDVEIIDQSTKNLFEERYAGLGAMIGPHFHHRKPEEITPIKDESLFPHIAKVKAKGTKEPFSHGIGRYAPWTVVKASDSYIKAVLKGTDIWKGVALKDLEGQDFTMEYEAKMIPQGLEIHLCSTSEKGSVVGLHTYYELEGGSGKVLSRVQNIYNDHGTFKEIPSEWKQDEKTLAFELKELVDYGFFPSPESGVGSIVLETGKRKIQVQYWFLSEENSWQLWHQKGGSFVCIEPLSAKDPRVPKLKENGIKILITIL